MIHLVKIVLMYEIKGPINSSFSVHHLDSSLAIDFLLITQRSTKFSETDGVPFTVNVSFCSSAVGKARWMSILKLNFSPNSYK